MWYSRRSAVAVEEQEGEEDDVKEDSFFVF